MKKSIIIILSLYFNNLFSQSDYQSILSIDNKKINYTDFLSIYNKNRSEIEPNYKNSIDEYLDLFINFKLKVHEAELLDLDKSEKFIRELETYRDQLAKPYLHDKKINQDIIKESYERLKYDISVSHILIKLNESSSPDDTLMAFKKINDIRNKFLNGENFTDLARNYSEDPSVLQNDGYLGYFTAFYMVYPFESAAYNTKIGDISNIVRTRFGYHILLINDKRKSLGEVKTAHIMIKRDNNSKSTNTKVRINEIYNMLSNENKNFSDLAKKYSDDKSSSIKGGELPWFGINRMTPPFEKAAFEIDSIGEFSKPFETQYGWHIVKLIDKKVLGSFEEEKRDIVNKIDKDFRGKISRKSLIEDLKNEYSYYEFKSNINFMKKKIESSDSNNKNFSVNENLIIITFDSINYYINDFLNYYNKLTKYNTFDEVFEIWSSDKIIRYENQILEEKYQDFKILMQEYRDGILLFEITNKKIWGKSTSDSIKLKEFYAKNKGKYMTEEKVVVNVIKSNNISYTKKIIKSLNKKKKLDKTLNNISKKSISYIEVDNELFIKNEIKYFDSTEFQIGNFKLIDSGNNQSIIIIDDIILPQIKKLNECKGEVISDYQKELENNWIEDLKNKYQFEINYNVLNLIKDNQIDKLDSLNNINSQKNYYNNKSFNQAFLEAGKKMGFSKFKYFKWRGNLYSTELE
ncbi:MAG: hypothetical protein CMD07_03550 [Flavobacteriales bacterium]|nr:hypothetical protein [Flavobacteriales bacterium]|tara:strand:+ start:4347 stop:6416 length:2070 start_codon:yes stop_codon:yes gene_type:complete